MNTQRRGATAAVMLVTALLLAGCSTLGSDTASLSANDQPGQLTPLPDSSVSSNALPPIAGSTTTDVASANLPNGPAADSTGTAGLATGSTAAPGPTAAGDNSFVSLNDVGKGSSGTGRNLAGGLSVEKLLGGWTVTSGTTECRLNLTYTAKGDTNRYRASAPGCAIAALAAVSAWQLSGTQVQLFDDTDLMIGTLLLSGNRFIGTLAGGQAITMIG